ncbi:TfoX/Sxy family protein [Anaeromyxobacter oryzae]|uniref:TfoX N-terminal domain-containing protein n=1 Tax=Anaeromyxobacter oryzae TaxID=2918170 RepID=A0ABM7WWB7_9BACT|nr:TfoX/Sxy family protein [Anaeromyxobacter oryzae]BDG03800.1 hypothetical protein AMOR_27960 [Anaeromyxobacter oryzae]
MANTSTFVEHALDLLSLVPGVDARRMFGGHGLYHRGAMFGLIDDDELFFKTDGETRPRFLEAGCRMWVYAAMQETSYYRPPDDAHEAPESMLPWARLAVDAALRKQAAKAAEAAAKAARRAAREAAQAGAKRSRRGAAATTARPGKSKSHAKPASPAAEVRRGRTATPRRKKPGARARGGRKAR